MPSESSSPGARFREAYSRNVAVPGVFCPLVARMAERLGFPAVYLSGGGTLGGLRGAGRRTRHTASS